MPRIKFGKIFIDTEYMPTIEEFNATEIVQIIKDYQNLQEINKESISLEFIVRLVIYWERNYFLRKK